MKRSLQLEDKNKIGYEYQWLLNKKKDDKKNISDIYESFEKLYMVYNELKKENKSLKRSLDELQEANYRYFELYNYGPVGLFHLDKKGYIKDLNKTSALMLSYNPEDMIRALFYKFYFREL